jgi:hypothetical protein
MAKVSGSTFAAGDSILLRRGDVWNESLTPPSSGAAGNSITFDAYGTGAPPNLTGYYAVPSSGWINLGNNAWKAALPAGYTTVNFCLFGSVWGQKVAAVSSNLTAQWDFYLANGNVYVYSVGNPANYYQAAIVPMALSNVPVINVNGKSWLTFQHILVNWFDQYGVYVQGTSDHLVFANMESDSMIPQGTQPLGFYVNESAPGPGDIKIYNAEAHMNYDGFRFDGAATAITMVNDKAYANRDGALVDNTGAVRYSYCHFYASSLAVAGSTDVEFTSGTGPIAGAGNIAADTPAAVQAWQRYPARVTLTVDDAGMTPGADTYYGTVVAPIADAVGVPVGAAITVGYTSTITPLISEIQGWINAGRDVTAHSISHTYYPNTDALDIRYTGTGTAAVLSISGKTLTITVTGAADGVSYNLAQGQPQGTMLGLQQALVGTGHFTATFNPVCQGPYGTGCSYYTNAALLAQDLADVTSQNVKSSVYAMQLDVTRLTTDEITLSRQWMTTNLTGLPATPVYVYPGGYENPNMETITAGVPYTGARGALHEGGTDNNGLPITGVKDTYASGFDVQNITSFGVNPSWMGLTPASLNQKVQALVWKQMVWGVPWGVFWHLNELTQTDPVGGTEITNLLQDFKNSGATIQKNTDLVNWLTTGIVEVGTDGNYYYKSAASSMTLDFRPTVSSPVVDAGQNLGTAYQFDINGVNQNSYGSGWEIGAHVFAGYSSYGVAGSPTSSYFSIGETVVTGVQLPQNWVNSNEWVGTTSNTINFPASSTGGSWTCGSTNYGPYTAGTLASLQQAVNDAESCRAAHGSGTTIVIPAGTLYSGSSGLVLPQTAGDTSTNFIVLQSSTPLPVGQTVCSHGIQDNIPESSQPGLRNVLCDGTQLSYQLGTTVTSVSGSFTLANGTSTSAGAYNDIASMYTIQNTGNNHNAISTAAFDSNNVGPHHFAILNAEARPVAGLVSTDAPIALGLGTETLVSQIPTHIHVAYSYLHGDWTDAPVTAGVATAGPTGANSLPGTMVFLGCINCSISYSYSDRNLRPGGDGHSIGVSLGQQLKIVHNWLEGGSEGHICGGWAHAIPIANFVTCQDMEDRGNRYTYPYSWMLAFQAGFCENNASCSGNGYVRKNAHEYKFSQRIVLDGNIFENVDNSGAQNGTIISAKTAQTSGGALGGNYWTIQANSTITNNVMRNSCNGPTLGDRSDNTGSNGGGTSLPAEIYNYSNNLLYNVNTSNPGCNVAGFNSNPQYGFRIGQVAPGTAWTGVTAARDVTGTIATLTLPSSAGIAESTVSVGDPIQVSGCTGDAAFNTTSTAMGPLAIAGTLPTGLTVVYLNTGTASGTATGCTVSIGQGWPNYLTYAHNSNFLNSVGNDPDSSALGGSNPHLLARNLSFTNSIFIGGAGPNSSFGEGTRTETEAFDASTEAFNNDLFPGRDAAAACPGHSAGSGGIAACYTEYSNAHVAITPPVTIYGTPTAYCTGNDPTAENCVGILGAMSQGSFPTVLNDWHQYRLCHAGDAACNHKASPYAAGGAKQASDSGDLGLQSTAAIDAAETSIQYGCVAGCGNGPQRDVPGELVSTTYFGIDYNSSASFPTTISHQIGRLWDMPGTEWPYIETANNVFSWSVLDSQLAAMYSNGVMYAEMPLSRTPNFASSQPFDTVCDYYNSSAPTGSGAAGQCDPPSDLNADGTGTDLYFRNWVAALAMHVNTPGYTNSHARILVYETWNEPDTTGFWSATNGTYDQLIRMEQDLYCIVKGGAFTIARTGESCPQVWATVTSVVLGAPADPSAYVLMPSYHVTSTAMAEAFLYCTGSGVGTQPCHGGGAGQTDVVNFHIKPGDDPSLTAETMLDSGMTMIDGVLQPSELAKPVFNTEGGFSSTGWYAPYTDADMQAAFVGRFFVYAMQKGISNNVWYNWNPALSGLGSTTANSAYGQVESWLAGATLASCSASAPGTAGTGLYTYSCPLTQGNGTPAMLIWDNSQSCSGGVCTTTNQAVPSYYTSYFALGGGPAIPLVSNHVPVGIKPTLLMVP